MVGEAYKLFKDLEKVITKGFEQLEYKIEKWLEIIIEEIRKSK